MQGIVVDLADTVSDIHAIGCNYDLRGILARELKVKVPGAEYLYAFKSGQWDGTAELWQQIANRSNAQYQAFRVRSGLMPKIVDAIRGVGYPVQVGFDSRAGIQGIPYKFQPTRIPYKFQPTQVPLRDYQTAALSAALRNAHHTLGWWPRGVLEMATGSGKTETAVAIYETNPVPTFFLVHRKDLLIQAKERFEKYGHRPGIIGAGIFEPRSDLNIATMQTIASITQDKNFDTTKWHALTGLIGRNRQLFIDECHLCAATVEKGNEFVGICDLFINSTFRFGLTATPFLRSKYDNALLEGVAGGPLYQVTSKQLIDAGFLTKPKVVMKQVPGQILINSDWRKLKNSTKARGEHWRKVEDKGIKFNELRTRTIIEEICKGPFPCLVLVKTVDQANFIRTLYYNLTQQELPFLSGSDSASTRRAAVEALNNGNLPVVMATTIFDEGVDVPALAKVILASGGKSQVKLIQRVGRALRLHAGKKEALVIDFADEHHAMLKRHAEERRAVWREQAFEVEDESVV